MVKTSNEQQKEHYQCEECGLKYREKEWAEKCEAWCKEHRSCNLEITAHAVNRELMKPVTRGGDFSVKKKMDAKGYGPL